MSLSIRTQIIVPIVFTILGGIATASIIGYEAINGQSRVEAVVEQALAAKSIAAKTSAEFAAVQSFVKSVTDMTTFVSASDVKTKFEARNAALEASLEAFAANQVSPKVSAEVQGLREAHATWLKDVRIVIGLDQAQEIPTAEKINRERGQMDQRIEEINQTVNEEANSAAASAGIALSNEIKTTLLVALGIAIATLVGLLLWVQRLSNPIIRITSAMKDLANGNTDFAMPARKGAREIEAMVSAVEVFRQSALENVAMQTTAEKMRSQMEKSRLEEQAKAEAAAAERLREATSGLAHGLKRLASGDLAFQLVEEFSPEFETLRIDFNQSVLQLEQTMVQISQSVGAIRNGSHEISRSADDLAKRTEQQAAMLEETAAALGEITANVSSSTKRTDEARNIAKQANSSAIGSGQVVHKAIDAMSRIEGSSQRISSIIGVIDQIAFQTNLLALNAGVEAARAGDAGRGFAVVAQEVRELAQRSAKAAKEIKELIENSTQEVGNGVQLVSQTGDSLKVIENYIVTINQHMDAIASSAQEQTVGLTEVNRAINQMDHVTQQNAAMVEETNASSATMANETDNLQGLIGMFQTNQSGRSTRPHVQSGQMNRAA